MLLCKGLIYFLIAVVRLIYIKDISKLVGDINMLSLSALINFTPIPMRKRSNDVKFKKTKSIIDKDENGVYKLVTYRAIATTIPRVITFKVYQLRNKRFTASSSTWVHCSCENYLYQWEVANTARGSSSIMNSNGAMPRIRNPRMRAGLCKHAYRCAQTVLRVSANIAPGIRLKKKSTKIGQKKAPIKRVRRL